MICPDCNSKTIPTFDGPQRWCTGCGCLFWMNGDGTIHDTYRPQQRQEVKDSYRDWYLQLRDEMQLEANTCVSLTTVDVDESREPL